MTIAAPLSASGRWIVDANGRRVKLAGLNWPAHYDPQVPDGLDRAPLGAICDMIASWGFNCVRLTFPGTLPANLGKAPGRALDANPSLLGLTPWRVYQVTTAALTSRGIMVIPNMHTLWPGSCCSQADAGGLWWNAAHPESEFISTWRTVARAFASNPLVVGYDLKNEPRTTTDGPRTYTPTWDGNPQTGFQGAYERAGNAVLAVSPGNLVICEGLDYAGNLTGVASRPVALSVPGRVVYECHDYAFWYKQPLSPEDYSSQMHSKAGYVTDPGHPYTAPLWLGEFGMANSSPAALGGPTGSGSPDAGAAWWWEDVTAWLRQGDYDWCWWTLSGTRPRVTEPRTNKLVNVAGDRESYGLMSQDWRGPASPALIEALRSLMPARLGPGVT